MHAFNIDNPNRIKYFLAQCYHETGGFKHFNENLNYSAKGLLKVFPDISINQMLIHMQESLIKLLIKSMETDMEILNLEMALNIKEEA